MTIKYKYRRMGCNEEKKRGQSPFLYFDYSGTEKSERWKKGDSPLFFMNNSGRLDYSRVEIAVATRPQPMKL